MAANMVNNELINVIFETLRAHVEGLSPEQQLDFSERVLSLSPTPAASSPASSFVAMDMTKLPAAHNLVTKAPRRKAVRKMQGIRGKKPVNAFMTFRSYVAPVLGKIPQKSRSPMLSLMWRAEERKGQFWLLGSAYSKIRDECNDCPSLDKFLEVAAEAVSIIPAKDYLRLTGWAIVEDGDRKVLEAAATNQARVIEAYPLQTNASTQDIIEYCFMRGLIQAMPRTSNTPDNAPVAMSTMSFAALPQNHDLEAPAAVSPSPSEMTLNDGLEFFDFNTFPTYSPSFDAITQDQQQAYNNTPAIAHWHPDIQPPVLGFDPNVVQNDFDPFTFNIFDFENL